MREIKFRALSNGKLYDCHACNFDNMTALLTVEGANRPVWCSVENFIQYTGLKDKNGKEIYECDIWNDNELHMITFNEGCFHVQIKGLLWFITVAFANQEYFDDKEIIGNALENKKHLEK